MANNNTIQMKIFCGILTIFFFLILPNCSIQTKNASTMSQTRTLASLCPFANYKPCGDENNKLCCPDFGGNMYLKGGDLTCGEGYLEIRKGVCKRLQPREITKLPRISCFLSKDGQMHSPGQNIPDGATPENGKRYETDTIYNDRMCNNYGRWVKFCLLDNKPFPEGTTYSHGSFVCKNGKWEKLCPRDQVPCGENSCCRGPVDNNREGVSR